MDSVNRDISMRLMVQAARRAVGRQYILITPQAMNSVKDMHDVKIIRLVFWTMHAICIANERLECRIQSVDRLRSILVDNRKRIMVHHWQRFALPFGIWAFLVTWG